MPESIRCALCGQSRTFTGEDAAELALTFLEDGGHYCVDIVDDRDSLVPYFGPADDRDEWSM